MALPLSNVVLKYYNEITISYFCMGAGTFASLMVAFFGDDGGMITQAFFFLSIFLCSASLNMYFMVVEVRVVPNVFGSIMELTICCAYFTFGLTVMITLMEDPW